MAQRGSSWLERVQLHSVSEEDLLWLIKACEANWTGISPEEIINEAMQDRVQIWRIAGRATGLVLTRTNRLPGGLELEVVGLAGRGIFPGQAGPIWADLLTLKKHWRCRWLTSHNVHPVLDRFYERLLGVPPRATLFVVED